MSVDSLGLSLDRDDTITFWASRASESACLTLGMGGAFCEIVMVRENVEALRDQLSDVLAGLDQSATNVTARLHAAKTQKLAVDVAARALDLAMAAEDAGAADLAASLRALAAETSAAVDAIDVTGRAFRRATADADDSMLQLVGLTERVNTELRQQKGRDFAGADRL